MSGETFIRVAKVGDVEPGGVIKADAGGRALALYNLDGTYYATDEICSHAHASLAEGFVVDDCIECPLHGAMFSIKTGAALSAPATEPIATYPVRVEGEDLLVGVP
jgi:nitrite reductase/ring-hydroxylating ferredoxin subunit